MEDWMTFTTKLSKDDEPSVLIVEDAERAASA
jgi:hypothetical protein